MSAPDDAARDDAALDALAARMRVCLAADPDDETADLRLDDYTDLQLIQQGGQGAVYSARQVSTGRRVAIKRLLARGPADERHVQRFEREVELAARLVHPNVVPVFDRGTTPAGDRWFAMEFIAGLPLDEFARQENLDRAERVALFDRLCAAVSYAHACGVVHRDLKPENVLVDDTGEPRVLDFGLAKPLDEGDGLGVTRAGEFLGTLTYAAPEQLLGEPDAVQAPTDIHALGALLYGLLAGTPPFAAHSTLGELVDAIAHNDPPPPTRATAQPDADLDALCLTCMAKRPEDRYADVEALRADLAAWREGRPLAARAHHRGYVLRRTLARHRVLVVAVLLVMASLLVATLVSWSALGDARQEAERAENLSDFFVDAMAAAVPGMNPREMTLVEWMQRVRHDVSTRFPGEPLSEAAVRDAVGHVLSAGGDHAEAEAEFARALALLDAEGQGSGRHAVSIRLHHAAMLQGAGRLADAEALIDRVARDLDELAPADARRFEGQLTRQRASLWLATDRPDEALALLDSSIAAIRARGDEAALGSQLAVQADALRAVGQLERALQRQLEAEELLTRQLGDDQINVHRVRHNRALVLADLGRFDEAVAILSDMWRRMVELLGPNHSVSLFTQLNLAGAVDDAGQTGDARELLEDLLSRGRPLLGEHHPTILTSLHTLGAILRRSEELGRAEECLRTALAGREATLGADADNTIRTRIELGLTVGRAGRLNEAEQHIAAAAESATTHLGPRHRTTFDASHSLAVLWLDSGRAEEAAELWALMIERAADAPPTTGARPGNYRLQRGLALARLGRLDEAVDVLESAHGWPSAAADEAHREAARNLLIQVHRARGDDEAAERWASPTP